MKTLVKKPDEVAVLEGAKLIKSGEIVGMPTETVYGLGADATNPDAIKKVFLAKGRPQDNPLIVHISSMEMMKFVVREIPEFAKNLADKFWPGPLTIVLPKSDNIPDCVSAGLSTVGVRMPNHKAALALIEKSGTPIAAPSANTSGKPSPTTANHVLDDMDGKIPLILDGGMCCHGVESTVISVKDNTVTILRPGFITAEDFESEGYKVEYSKGVFSELSKGEIALSPGMKYKHYSPKADVIIVDGEYDKIKEFAKTVKGEGVYFLTFNKDSEFPCSHLAFGSTAQEQATNFYDKLREFDELKAKTVYAMSPIKDGVGVAVYNRMLRSAGFEVIKL